MFKKAKKRRELVKELKDKYDLIYGHMFLMNHDLVEYDIDKKEIYMDDYNRRKLEVAELNGEIRTLLSKLEEL